eukprot:TRINITY_DN2472_c0_g1_i1.p1 TRINITY_DN2472_c0_g1~~TRINITY_DN2472_c0_g1_i1.p1  ORF type:complete len:100 (-),score=17.26 TRINITY_DN2472_c0_g1_i1:281-580(-)
METSSLNTQSSRLACAIEKVEQLRIEGIHSEKRCIRGHVVNVVKVPQERLSGINGERRRQLWLNTIGHCKSKTSAQIASVIIDIPHDTYCTSPCLRVCG